MTVFNGGFQYAQVIAVDEGQFFPDVRQELIGVLFHSLTHPLPLTPMLSLTRPRTTHNPLNEIAISLL